MKTIIEIDRRIVLLWSLALLLIWGALSKIANPAEFLDHLLGYRLPLYPLILSGVAVVLPWIELLVGLMLIARVWTETALAWAFVLFVIFSICTAQAAVRGLAISCACFDLRLMGIRHGSELTSFIESAGFAFTRSVVLAGIACYLISRDFWRPDAD